VPEPAEVRGAPPAVRALSHVLRWMPVGRYRLIYESRRFAIAPFVARLPRDLGGLSFHCDLRDSVAREVCYTGRYEPQETQLASRLLRHGDVFADVGANWGYFTLAAAHWVGRSGRVLAFEPEPRLFKLLRMNVALNALEQVHTRRLAIADRSRRVPFTAFLASDDNWGQSRAARAGTVVDFVADAAALDDVLDGAGIDRVALTKMDVEGGEAAALAGMQRGLRAGRYSYVLLECHPALLRQRGHGEEDTLRPLVDARYRLWTIPHTPQLHRRAARRPLSTRALLRPYVRGAFDGSWPHLLAAAPGTPDPA
jgi:FkbM family methyltransferase